MEKPNYNMKFYIWGIDILNEKGKSIKKVSHALSCICCFVTSIISYFVMILLPYIENSFLRFLSSIFIFILVYEIILIISYFLTKFCINRRNNNHCIHRLCLAFVPILIKMKHIKQIFRFLYQLIHYNFFKLFFIIYLGIL